MDILQYEFMRNAFAAAFLVSIACGIVGTYVVVKRIVAISGGIAHTAFGGIGLGYLINADPILTAVPWSVLSALGMGIVSKETKISEDTSIGIFWAVGMALGILFIHLSEGYAPDLFSYLFGNILTVPVLELAVMGILDLVIIIFTFFLYKELKALSFDEEFAEVSGVPTRRLYLLLLCLVALSVVVMIKVVGIILVIALLTLPAAIAKQHTNSLGRMMAFSVIACAILTLGGLWLSYVFDLPSGATIILLLAAAFLTSYLLRKMAG
ncbi:MAG: metal ABC transporter permease [Candidatus Micrarchaeota archaeon]